DPLPRLLGASVVGAGDGAALQDRGAYVLPAAQLGRWLGRTDVGRSRRDRGSGKQVVEWVTARCASPTLHIDPFYGSACDENDRTRRALENRLGDVSERQLLPGTPADAHDNEIVPPHPQFAHDRILGGDIDPDLGFNLDLVVFGYRSRVIQDRALILHRV